MQPGLTIIPPSATKTYSSSPKVTARHSQPMMGFHANTSHSQAILNGANNFAAPDATRTLFLGDLSYFCSEQDLCRLFVAYGSITSVRVRRGVTGESLMHGFITLGSPEAALRAMRDLDGAEFMGRNMRVQLSTDGQRPNLVAKENFVQVHVSFISKQTNILVSERVLREIFAPFGRIADITIKKHTLVPKQNRQSGYGFVYYFDTDAANHAMSVLKQNTVHDITLDCSISYKSQHDKPSHAHGRLHAHAHSLNDMSASQWDINTPDVRSFAPGVTYSGSQSTAHLSHFQQTMPRARSPVSDLPMSGLPRSASARYNHNSNGAAMQANPPRGLVLAHANPSLPRERHYEQESRFYTGEELEAELARMSMALHQHYQERELERERERELARLAQPPRTFSGRDWEDQSHLSYTSGSVSRPTGPSLPHLNSFHSLSSISQGSAVHHPQPKTRPQLTRVGPQFDSFYSDDEPVTTVNSFSMSELDRLLPPPPSDSVFGTRNSQQQPQQQQQQQQQQRYMRSNAFPEDQARALNQLIDFDLNLDLSLQ